MYCKNCGEVMNDNQAICLKCGVNTGEGNSFCSNCGQPMNPEATVCLNCGVSQVTPKKKDSNGKLTKSKEGKIIAGVHSGLAKKAGCNPWILRIIHIILHFFVVGFLIDIAYIIAAIAMPGEE